MITHLDHYNEYIAFLWAEGPQDPAGANAPPTTPTEKPEHATMHNLYIIYDKVAATIIGGLHLHKHHAAAVRFFTDVAQMENSNIARHPSDYALYVIGTIDDQGNLSPESPTIVMDGAAWAQTQTPTTD